MTNEWVKMGYGITTADWLDGRMEAGLDSHPDWRDMSREEWVRRMESGACKCEFCEHFRNLDEVVKYGFLGRPQ